jgi:PAS domain S-box-containing protein
VRNDAPMSEAELFAAIVEHSAAAIIAKDLEGTVLVWNKAAEHAFGWSAQEMIGQSIRRLIPADRHDEEDLILQAVGRGELVALRQTVRLRKDGSSVNISVQISPIRDQAGTIVGASKIARDITEELRTRQELHQIESRFAVMADNISQLAWIALAEGGVVWWNRRWMDFTGVDQATALGTGWHAFAHPDHLDRVLEATRQSIETGTELRETFPLRRHDGTYRWFLCTAIPHRSADGKVDFWFGTATDITEQRDAERRIELLLMEVNHRSKNLLSVVQSMARRTASSGDDFIPRLEQRIAALAANQDVLVQRNWSAVPLRELIDAQLSVIEQAKAQTEVIGPDVVIQAKTAEAMSMALHELAHNAEKYGAYSVPEGRVVIGWQILGEEADAEFVLEWAESGGPAVAAPGEPGFGTRIIRDVPKARLGGEVAVDYAQTGFRFTLHCPAANVLAQPD